MNIPAAGVALGVVVGAWGVTRITAGSAIRSHTSATAVASASSSDGPPWSASSAQTFSPSSPWLAASSAAMRATPGPSHSSDSAAAPLVCPQ